MKSGMLMSLLLLSLLIIHQAQGMRFIRKGSLTINSQQFMSHKTLEEKTDKDVVEEINKHFAGRARKLMSTSPIPTTATIAKNENKMKKEKSAKKKENPSVNSAEQRLAAAADETYPGILDIAGMDYSQARRKPPIHN
ncbi:uncharacterized protein LOC130988170 [Salvia miltiorrhiza]|uniref:uncharacterized protein LOC130988170 n=1 Tax=Salvia miltiorrhiza TaxID=226208 RepID=UPI0025AC5CE5|nr:uncharacterized protein LOC130988170 [Salvia miltiorrhiza]